MFNDSNLSVRNFRREGILNDSDTDESVADVENQSWYKIIADAVWDEPIKYGGATALCVGFADRSKGPNGEKKNEAKIVADCGVALGEQICADTGSPDVCDAVKTGKTIASMIPTYESGTGNSNTNTDTGVKVDSLEREREELDGLIGLFKRYDCSALTLEQRTDITDKLNELEPKFVSAGRKSEFDKIIGQMTCDVVKEFKCDNKDESVIKFVPNPICKPTFNQSWLKPVAIGGATGVGVGFAFNKIAKGPVTYSILAGIVAGGGVTYYLHSKVMKDYEEKLQEVS